MIHLKQKLAGLGLGASGANHDGLWLFAAKEPPNGVELTQDSTQPQAAVAVSQVGVIRLWALKLVFAKNLHTSHGV